MSEEMSVADCWFLTGPTASGKTSVGIELARLLDAEIVSLDSMALYRGMDIGTAKPDARAREQVPHHLIDVVEPSEEYSVARYVEAANRTVAQIRSSGREVLFVGGTPLYLKALLRGLFEGPAADWEFRREVEQEVRDVGQEALVARLRQVDPLAAARLHPNDTRRMIRALEVYKITGQPISHQQSQFDEGRPPEACRVFALEWPPEPLHRRIDRRVEAMFASGLVDEVQRLTTEGNQLGRTASQAVGYREAIEYLAGERDLEQTIEKVKVRTRRFAKRQRTWFRSLRECRGIAVSEGAEPAKVAQEIRELAGGG